MKKFTSPFFMIYFLFLINISCKKNKTNTEASSLQKNEISSNKDTIITNSGIYLISPDTAEIDSIKNKIGDEDFYTIADDSNNYISEISTLLNGKFTTLKQDKINFKNENFLFDKKKNENLWLIIDYKKGNQPKMYSLVDYYLGLKDNAKQNTGISDRAIKSYINNKNFDVFTFDINNDGLSDKIFSGKPNSSDSLVLFFNEKNNYVLRLKSTNLSQDGGQQVSAIVKENDGFSITTNFPADENQYQYFINYKDKFLIKKVVHQYDSWQNKTSQKCQFPTQIDMNQSTGTIFKQLIAAEENAKCKQ